MSRKLITFPCAGGSANNFNKIIKSLDCDICNIEYSGHWKRCDERLYDSMRDCIGSLYSEIEEMVLRSDEIFLLGHSMGAIVAYEIAEMLLARGFSVKTLFLLACMPPDEMEFHDFLFDNDDAIRVFLNKIRQVPQRVLDSTFFAEELLPVIRNDFYVLNNYVRKFQLSKKIAVRIICIDGKNDPLVTRMSDWQRYTSSICRCVECEGEHFFLNDSSNVSKIRTVILEEFSENSQR